MTKQKGIQCFQGEHAGTKHLNIGIDSGNGFLKAFSDEGDSVKIPSYIHIPQDETESNIVAKEGCYVLYVSGSRVTELGGKKWLIGSPAYSASPTGKVEVAQLSRGKVDYSLQLLLGAIGCMGIKSQNLEVNLCLSVHHAKSFREDLTKALKGCHVVELGTSKYNITISKILIVNEGMGTLASLLATKRVKTEDKLLLLDLGYGTSISTVYQFGKQIDRQVMDFGVKDLYAAIAKHPDMVRTRNGREGDFFIIRQGIESKNFLYGSYEPFNFYDIYHACLHEWSAQNLRNTLSTLKNQVDSASCMFAVGGGALLPMVDKYLKSKGFEVLSNASTLNAEGLLALAKNRLGDKS